MTIMRYLDISRFDITVHDRGCLPMQIDQSIANGNPNLENVAL